MAKIVRLTDKALDTSALKGQAKQILDYLVRKYGVNKDIDQSEIVLDLNAHQFDTEVLDKQSTSPISRLYEFHRSKTYSKEGYLTVTSTTAGKAPREAGKWKKLEASYLKLVDYAKALEVRCINENVDISDLESPLADVEDDEDDIDTDAA